jgi:2-(1,2-epoxy-1,2-dihydrophenyl)acetyl-CoA isomerase
MGYKSLRFVMDNGIARLTLIQPERGNPIDADMCAEIAEVANIISEAAGVRCVLLTAEGENFSFGGDISVFMADLDTLPLHIKRGTGILHSGIVRLQRMDAPIVAAVQGVCAGGMSGFVAGSDIVIAEQNARFVAAYTGIGFCCDAGSSIMYTRRMGAGRTRKFLLLNEVMDAPAALDAGLVDEVVAPDQLLARAEAVAQQLAAGPTQAYGEIRRLLTGVHDRPLETQLELEAQALARLAGTADAREGVTAFSQKRMPEFKGA